MPLLHFPNELILQISQELSPPDLNSLLTANRSLSTLLQSPLYDSICRSEEFMVKYSESALHSAANRGDESAIGKLLERGALCRIDNDKFMERVVESFDELALRTLLDGGFDVNMRNSSGKTLLSMAAGGGVRCAHGALGWLLERRSVDVNATDLGSCTPLVHAVHGQNVSAVRALLADKRVDVNLPSPSGRTVLHQAAVQESEEVIRLLLEHGDIEANPCDDRGLTPLSSAVGERKEVAVRALLRDPRVDVNLFDNCGQAPLHYAADLGVDTIVRMLLDVADIESGMVNYGEVVRLLLEDERTDVNLPDKLLRTPLHHACKNSQVEIVRLLLAHPSTDPNAQDSTRSTPLSLATRLGGSLVGTEPTVDALLLDPRVIVNSKNEDGLTPFHLAVEHTNIAVVFRLFNDPRVDVNSRNSTLQTPLHTVAATAGQFRDMLAEMLIAREGSDVNARDQSGMTPLSTALRSDVIHREPGQLEGLVKTFLRHREVDANLQDNQGRGPLYFGVKRGGDGKVLEMLLKHEGVDVGVKDREGRDLLEVAEAEGSDIGVKRILRKYLGKEGGRDKDEGR
ncbi:unnamed protein product [Tuber aestivum]|uniref:F-box domain-containing protein n=1 Tax=Tuber aestivum TaxID=59557 RepID=A0A292Q0K4_9PEZI|nr:unnamed protein product [Tuber aestivum]